MILPLKLENVCYQHQNSRHDDRMEALKNINISFEAGIKTVILGPNGAGKSILLKLCHGLLEPTEGHLYWNNLSPEEIRKNQAMVFTKPCLLNRSVWENLDYVLKLQKISREERDKKTTDILNRFGLSALKERAALQLSTGEQQRLSFALALSFGPTILFLDEPTANLDPRATATIEHLVLQAHDQGTTIVMTTHDLLQARRIADRIIFIDEGRIIEEGNATSFFAAPKSPEARDFLCGRLSE